MKKILTFLWVSMYMQSYLGIKEGTNAKETFYFIFLKRHIFASADTLTKLQCLNLNPDSISVGGGGRGGERGGDRGF